MAKPTKSKAKAMSSKDMKKTRGGATAENRLVADQSMIGSLDRSMAGSMKEPTMQAPKPRTP
jgi:hypothetical protein